jgi:hypothetical protein
MIEEIKLDIEQKDKKIENETTSLEIPSKF